MNQIRSDLATGFDGWPTDHGSLMALSDAAAEADLWADAACLGERAVSVDPEEVDDRVQVAWRMWRAGSPSNALDLLAAIPEQSHSRLEQVRAAAVATRDRTPDTMDALMAVADRLPRTPQDLLTIALAAREVGDHEVAHVAAHRYRELAPPDDPAVLRILARTEAADGELDAAVAATEQACSLLAADHEAPIEDVVDALREGGHDDLALRFLAEGFLTTGRLRYGELLDELLPARIRQRNTWIVAPVLVLGALVVGIGPLEILRSSTLATAFVLAVVAGVAVSIGGVLLRVPGTTRAQTARLAAASSRYRWRRAGLRTARAPVPSDRCRCSEHDRFAGPIWRAYRDRHLVTIASDRELDASLLRCPATDQTWMHLGEADVTVRAVLPDRR